MFFLLKNLSKKLFGQNAKKGFLFKKYQCLVFIFITASISAVSA